MKELQDLFNETAKLTPWNCSGVKNRIILRDYFAGQAMVALYANPSLGDWPHDELTRSAYRAADAMLEARVQCVKKEA